MKRSPQIKAGLLFLACSFGLGWVSCHSVPRAQSRAVDVKVITFTEFLALRGKLVDRQSTVSILGRPDLDTARDPGIRLSGVTLDSGLSAAVYFGAVTGSGRMTVLFKKDSVETVTLLLVPGEVGSDLRQLRVFFPKLEVHEKVIDMGHFFVNHRWATDDHSNISVGLGANGDAPRSVAWTVSAKPEIARH